MAVFVVLIVAVAVGVVMASLLFVKRMADLQNKNIRAITGETEDSPLSAEAREILKAASERIMLFHLGGPMSFGVAKDMGRIFSIADKSEALVLDLTDVPLIDSSASLALRDGIEHVQEAGQPVFMAGAQPAVAEILDRLGTLDLLADGRNFASRAEALRAALDHIGASDKS